MTSHATDTPHTTPDATASLGSRLAEYGATTFSSLRLRNYRLYFIGQGISLCGTWMQSIAQSWLVLELTNSGTMLGIATALQFLPVLLLAPYGGLLADRLSKRKLLVGTQTAAALLALGLGALVVTGVVRLWMVFGFSIALGLINALDNPARQAFVHELVGAEHLKNAVSLNSVEVNLSRVVGPAIAGVLIARIGTGPCFIINGVSFAAVLACLFLMRDSELHRAALVEARKGQLAEGFAYVRDMPALLIVLVMMAIVGTFTFEFQVTLPLLARFAFHGGADSYALLSVAMGVGAVVGGLVIAGRRSASIGGLTLASFAFGISTLLISAAPSMAWAVVAMLLVGGFSIAFTALTNTLLQLQTRADMRGRVMSLWTMAFLGSTLIGAPIVGWLGQQIAPRWSTGIGGIAAIVAGFIGMAALRVARARREETLEPVEPPAIGQKEDYV